MKTKAMILMKCFIPIIILAFYQIVSAQGMYSGTKSHPMPVIWGEVAKLSKDGAPIKIEDKKIEVKLVKVYYEGEVVAGGLAKPTSGEVQEAFIGDKKVTLEKSDIGTGYLNTKEFGKIAILFSSSLTSDYCVLAVNDTQLQKIKSFVK